MTVHATSRQGSDPVTTRDLSPNFINIEEAESQEMDFSVVELKLGHFPNIGPIPRTILNFPLHPARLIYCKGGRTVYNDKIYSDLARVPIYYIPDPFFTITNIDFMFVL